jgi:hypothetical protein
LRTQVAFNGSQNIGVIIDTQQNGFWHGRS